MAAIHNMLAASGDGFITVFLTIAANVNNYVLNTAKVANYIPGATRVVLTINPGVTVGGSGTALTVDGSWHERDKLQIINNGDIIGAGGSGGASITNSLMPANMQAYAGASGSNALLVSAGAGRPKVEVQNLGTIAGGGGGGGASGGYVYIGNNGDGSDFVASYGAPCPGGGGAGVAPGGGGGGNWGAHISGSGEVMTSPQSGSRSAGGAGSYTSVFSGGTGGALGQPGGAGFGDGNAASAQSGGAGGYAVIGNASITWVATGTRLGAIA